MPISSAQMVIATCTWSVPRPFQRFAVRSEEARHALQARAPWGQVRVLRTGFLGAPALQRLAALAQARLRVGAAFDVDYAPVTLAELAAAVAPGSADLVDGIAAALRATGVLGDDIAAYRRQVAARIDCLGARGAGFHNDVSRHWTACLFWNLTLAAAEVEFVMPHAGVRLALQPGDLIVFDPAVPHGLCRPRDGGQAVAASFEHGDDAVQTFLSGELALSDGQWAALGAPWCAVEQQGGALDLLVAAFDERSGAVKQLRSLRDGMRPSLRYDDEGAPPA